MNEKKRVSFLIVGLALFAMFFGSGNLIFPLYIGHLAQGEMVPAALGFLLTSVLVPFLGVVAMVLYKGDYQSFFAVLGKRGGALLTAVLLTVWIPLGSGPRCIDLAYSSLASYCPVPPLWMFSLLYIAIVSIVTSKKRRMLDLLGYVLTPVLLLCLALIFFKGVSFSDPVATSGHSGSHHFINGLVEGYNTMDLIASFFFTASVIGILKQSTPKGSHPLSTTFKACLVGMGLLVVIYVSLIVLAAFHSPALTGVPKDRMLATIAKVILGPQLGGLSVVAVFLACFTTSVALVVVYADFLRSLVFKGAHGAKWALFTTLALTFAMSTTGLEGITFLTAPILQVFYPLLIGLIAFNLSKKVWLEAKQKVQA